jgi:hypothetical protein
MEQQAFLFDLIRIKFGFMACFHYIFVPLTLGLIVSAACMESACLWTRDAAWRLASHFWFRLFTLGWLLGLGKIREAIRARSLAPEANALGGYPAPAVGRVRISADAQRRSSALTGARSLRDAARDVTLHFAGVSVRVAGAAACPARPRGAAAVCELVAADLRPRPSRNRIMEWLET